MIDRQQTKPQVGAAPSHRVRERWAAMHASVFAKLLATMVTMAASAVLLVSAFFWSIVRPTVNGGGVHEAHAAFVAVLLLVLAAVSVTAHAALKRLLRPLRALSDGVARLSEGQLDVVLSSDARDEFATLTDAFNQMVGRVRGMIDARDQLLMDVSHELRSPVTRMRVAIELLPDGQHRAGMVHDLAEMERMLAELLELERLRDGRGVRTARHDLAALVHEAAAVFQDTPPGVRMVPASSEMQVDIDADLVRTVLRNLLENAAKYSLPTSAPIEVSAWMNADTVVIRVTDDGVGIPEGDVERVFEPFFRVDRSRSKSTGGYGLGLSICKRVMETHGGTIGVERRGGRGTCFVLTFPKPVLEPLEPDSSESPWQESAARRREIVAMARRGD